jgi:putative membrane protein
MMGGGGLLSLLLLVGLVVLIVWAVNRGMLDRGNQGGVSLFKQERTAEEILKERFARGEIDAKEYERSLEVLRKGRVSEKSGAK